MRRHLIVLLILILAACGSDDNQQPEQPANPTQAPADAVQPPQDAPPEGTADPDVNVETTLSFEELVQDVLGEPPTPQIFPTVTLSEGALPVPLPGTLVASETEEAQPNPGPFDRITFLQTGGTNDIIISFEITSDGIVERDGQTASVSPDVIQRLDQMIDDLNFMGLQGTFMGPAPNDDVYQYRIAVIDGDSSRAVWSQDGFMPDQYREFLGLIRTVGDSVITAPEVGEPVVPGGN